MGVLAAAPAAQPDPPTNELHKEIRVPVENGRVGLRDLVGGVLEAYRLDPNGLRIPDRAIRVDGFRGYLTLTATRKALGNAVRFGWTTDRKALVLTIDREKLRDARRNGRARIARLIGKLAGQDVSRREFALDLPDPLRPDEPLIVLIHGVEGGAGTWRDLQAHLAGQRRPHQVATYRYGNDESVERAAAALAAKLKALGKQRVFLVGHSMGGLVARAVVELPGLDPGNVDLLIQIGTPNRGSHLGGMLLALEAKQIVKDGADLSAFLGSLMDGLGEAQGDLLPGSVFLTKLNARPRNPRVRYRLLLGTSAPFDRKQWETVRPKLLALARRLPASEVFQGRFTEILRGLDEVVRGEGDGAVSVKKGQLEGVEAVLTDRGHIGLVRLRGPFSPPVRAEDHPAFSRVLGWIEAERRSRAPRRPRPE